MLKCSFWKILALLVCTGVQDLKRRSHWPTQQNIKNSLVLHRVFRWYITLTKMLYWGGKKAAFRCCLVPSVLLMQVGCYDVMSLACFPVFMILYMCFLVAESIRRILMVEFQITRCITWCCSREKPWPFLQDYYYLFFFPGRAKYTSDIQSQKDVEPCKQIVSLENCILLLFRM